MPRRRSARCATRRPIRARCAAIPRAVDDGRSRALHARPQRSSTPSRERVAALTRARFPDLKIPYHSRWRHFEAGGVDRKAELDAQLAGRSRGRGGARAHRPHGGERAARRRRRRRLALPPRPRAASAFSRSEGLGVASFRAFVAGRFSSDAGRPAARRRGGAAAALDAAALRRGLPGARRQPAGRPRGPRRAAAPARRGAARAAATLRRRRPARPPVRRAHAPAARAAADHRHRSCAAAPPRAARASSARCSTPSAASGRAASVFEGVPVGDAWPHPAGRRRRRRRAGWVPFHKLSQWLSYSLLEPFEWAGVQVDRARRADRPARVPQRRPAASTPA